MQQKQFWDPNLQGKTAINDLFKISTSRNCIVLYAKQGNIDLIRFPNLSTVILFILLKQPTCLTIFKLDNL